MIAQSVDKAQTTPETIQSNNFINSGYVFEKWNTKANGTGTSYLNNGEITLTQDVILYAIWKPIEISFVSQSTSVEKGKTIKLTPTLNPADAQHYTLEWSSGNNAVAIVNSTGTVTGVAMGTVTITVSTGIKSASQTITVTQVPLTNASATNYRGNNGSQYSYYITGTSDGSIWGTDIYTDDSNIAKAAVHAGKVSIGETKWVTIQILAGQSSYSGTTRNGITTSSYGSWGGSYKFI